MDKIEKLLRKISKKQRQQLFQIINSLINNDLGNLDVKKIKDTQFYRVRKGNYRIIFAYNKQKEIIIISIQQRSEKTYKSF